jgi:hypothetical protein
MIVLIPFAGFYNSWHDANIDGALEQMLSDSSGNQIEGLTEHACRGNFSPAFDAYAKAYAEAFLEEFELGGTFESISYPREYNFTTDRIFCDIPEQTMQRLLREVPRPALDKCAVAWFKSRSGFMSHYSHHVDTWGDIEGWDHNQLGCLLEAHVGEGWTQERESHLMEHWLGNGYLDNALCECPLLLRLANIASYLRNRAERKWK